MGLSAPEAKSFLELTFDRNTLAPFKYVPAIIKTIVKTT